MRKNQSLTYMLQIQGHPSTLKKEKEKKKKTLMALRAQIDTNSDSGRPEYPTVTNK
jgi:hypothetical protein